LQPKAILALGKIAWDGYLEVLKQRGVIGSRTLYKFAHGAEAEVAPGMPRLFGVYHRANRIRKPVESRPQCMRKSCGAFGVFWKLEVIKPSYARVKGFPQG